MPLQSNWEHLNVPLPNIRYENTTTGGQGKGSTTWAAHSHTPLGVQSWDEFGGLVMAEGNKARNLAEQNIDFAGQLQMVRRYFSPVSREEDVTNRLELVLSVFADDAMNLSGGIQFLPKHQQIIGNPDIVAIERNDAAFGVGPRAPSPSPGKRAGMRRATTDLVRQSYRFPFETKPDWKFGFLNTFMIINQWSGVPDEYFDDEKMQVEVPLPSTWSAEKKKVFHLVRQVYGQMVSDDRRYGIIHTYENWFFCKRGEDGILRISSVFRKENTAPSVFQAIKTMIGFDDYFLGPPVVHPKSAQLARTKKRGGRNNDKSNTDKRKSRNMDPRALLSGPNTRASKNRRKQGEKADGKWLCEGTNMATSLPQWEWDVFDYTDRVLLLTTKKDPTIIAKMQCNPREHHVGSEMANEAAILEALKDNSVAKEVIPRFYGHSRRWGVSVSYFGKELDDFDDIGPNNLSDELKFSAVRAVEVLSEAGILHNDIELRNFVQSKEGPNCAKIIDFGRATFSSDSKRLAKQVDRVRALLNTDDSSPIKFSPTSKRQKT